MQKIPTSAQEDVQYRRRQDGLIEKFDQYAGAIRRTIAQAEECLGPEISREFWEVQNVVRELNGDFGNLVEFKRQILRDALDLCDEKLRKARAALDSWSVNDESDGERADHDVFGVS